MSTKGSTDISQAINAVLQSSSEDFLTLVRLAGLSHVRDFRYKDMRGVDFSNVDLTGFDFTGANIEGCKFQGAKVSGAIWRDVKGGTEVLRQSADWLIAKANRTESIFGLVAEPEAFNEAIERGKALYRRGDSRKAMELLQKELSAIRSQAKSMPLKGRLMMKFLMSLIAIGHIHLDRLEVSDAELCYQEATKFATKWTSKDVDRTLRSWALSRCRYGSGRISFLHSDLQNASRQLKRSVQIARKLVQVETKNTELPRDVTVSLSALADLLKERRDFRAALRIHRECLEIRRKLAVEDVSKPWLMRDVSSTLNSIGHLLKFCNEFPEALRHFEEAVQIARKLANADSSNTDVLRNLSVGLAGVGDVYLESANFAGALQYFEEGFQITTQLSIGDAKSAAIELNLALFLLRLGDVDAVQGRKKRAIGRYRRGLAIVRALAHLSPGVSIFHREVEIFEKRLQDLGDSAAEDLKTADTNARS